MLGIYTRISQEKEEGKDRSINDQKQHGIELAKKLGVKYKVYVDEGISGTLPIDERPQFSQLIDDIQDGVIDKVFAYDNSRIERSVEVRFVIKKIFKENNIEFYTSSGKIDLDDEESEFFGDLLSVINSYYVKITKRKVKSVMKRNAKEGKSTGRTPYGYGVNENNEWIVDDEESKVIRKIFDLRKKGWGARRIVEYLKDNDIPTRYNKLDGVFTHKNAYTGEVQVIPKSDVNWSHSIIERILKNKVYMGERYYGGEVFKVPAIISKEEFTSLQKKKVVKGAATKHKYLLNGVMECGHCGARYSGRMGSEKDGMYYRCVTRQYKNHTCDSRNIKGDYIEGFIWSRFFLEGELERLVLEYVKNGDNDKNITRLETDIKTIEKKIKELKKKRDRAIELTIEGILSKNDVQSQLRSIDNGIDKHTKEIAILKERLLEVREIKTKLDMSFDGYLDASFKTRQEMVNRYIKGIKIHYTEPYYNITVEFKLDGLGTDFYTMDRYYRWAKDSSGEPVWGKIWMK